MAIVAGAAVWMFCSRRNATVRLPTGEMLQIRNVSLGTLHPFDCEPIGKQILRSIIPDRFESVLGPPQRVFRQTAHESLVLWVLACQSNGAPITIQDPEAVLANGFVAKGNLRTGQKLIPIEFPCFARETALVPLRVRIGSSQVDFVVQNPRLARPAKWTGRPLPQTNNVGKTTVALNKLVPTKPSTPGPSEYVAHLQNCAAGTATGWTRWRITAFDRWGNYVRGNYNDWGGRPTFQFLRPETGPWRLLINSEEYLSAGDVPYPEKQLCLLLPLTARMQELGIRFLFVVGEGSYLVANGAPSRAPANPLPPSKRALLSFSSLNGSTASSLNLTAHVAGLLCVSEAITGQRVRTRFREQSREKGARIFEWRTPIASATNVVAGTIQVAQFFVSGLPSEFKKPMEVEVISEASTEFFLDPKPD